MFRHYGLLTGICVLALCCGNTYGAATMRTGAVGRAGSLRAVGGGTTSSVKANPSNNTSSVAVNGGASATESARLANLSGISGAKSGGRINATTGSGASNQSVADLRNAIQELRNDYNALDSQYNTLSNDVSAVSDTAQAVRAAVANNTSVLTTVRGDLNVAKSDIEDLKTSGGFDEGRVQETVEATLAWKNYATQAALAATDAVARGAVQTNELQQKLNTLNIADKNYVDSKLNVNQVLDAVGDNYYSKSEVNGIVRDATRNLVDKSYVNDHVGDMLNGYATEDYVDIKVATGMDEDQVLDIVGGVVNRTMGNYYSKGETNNAIYEATRNLVGRGYVDNAVSNLVSENELVGVINGLDMVNAAQVQDIVGDSLRDLNYVDKGYVRTVLDGYATEGYVDAAVAAGMDEDQVRGIVNNTLGGAMGNYYSKGETEAAIYDATKNFINKSYVDSAVSNLVSENELTAAIRGIDVGLKANEVQRIVDNSLMNLNYAGESWVLDQLNTKTNGLASEDYVDEKIALVDLDENEIRNIVAEYNYKTADEIAQMIALAVPEEVQMRYEGGLLQYTNSEGKWVTVVDLDKLVEDTISEQEFAFGDGADPLTLGEVVALLGTLAGTCTRVVAGTKTTVTCSGGELGDMSIITIRR